MTRLSVTKRKGWRHFYIMWFMHDGKPNRLKPWCGCLLHLSILQLSRNGPSHGVKRHLGGKYSKTFFSGEFSASFNRIISGPGMPLQVFIKLFFSLFGLSKYVKQKINNPNNFSSLPSYHELNMTSNNPAGLMYLFQIVFALYMLVTTIVLINLLIAMMSDTYQRIQVRPYSLPSCDDIISHSLPCFAVDFAIPFSFFMR